jgi:ankyrin repeat protein
LNFRDDATIIHDILEYGGILQPFLAIPNLDLERRDPKGRTLLLAAARSGFGTFSSSNVPRNFGHKTWQDMKAERAKLKIGDPPPAQTLFDKGGNLLALDNEGNNVLHFLSSAVVHNIDEYQETFSLFIEKAPSLIHQKNYGGSKPFHVAIKDRRTWNADRLINAGADPLEKDPEGNTPLHHLAPKMSQVATEKNWLACWEKFLALGVPINSKNNKGETAVFAYFHGGTYCSENHHRENYAHFEDAGADLFARNNEGQTLLHIVATKKFRREIYRTRKGPLEPDTADTFRFLMEKGLDPMAEDNSQRTALVSSSLVHFQAVTNESRRTWPQRVIMQRCWPCSNGTKLPGHDRVHGGHRLVKPHGIMAYFSLARSGCSDSFCFLRRVVGNVSVLSVG